MFMLSKANYVLFENELNELSENLKQYQEKDQ